MRHGIHFISGLPRSGSTLLAALLRQNPRFHAGMTSPVGALYMALEGALSRRNEAAVFITDQQRRDVLRGVFGSYYRAIEAEQTIFDTNRAWCAKLPALVELFPTARVICCVRSISWIMDSVERLVRRNAFELSGMFGYEAGGTVFTRVNRLASGDGMVGYALDALKEAFFGEHADRLILVEYQALTRDPEGTFRLLYQMLGEPYFSHDFENVSYEADSFDLAIGSPGLHRVRRKVAWLERPTILPPELFSRFENDAFWRLPEHAARNVPTIRFEPAADAPPADVPES
jgi:sulfotransferase